MKYMRFFVGSILFLVLVSCYPLGGSNSPQEIVCNSPSSWSQDQYDSLTQLVDSSHITVDSIALNDSLTSLLQEYFIVMLNPENPKINYRKLETYAHILSLNFPECLYYSSWYKTLHILNKQSSRVWSTKKKLRKAQAQNKELQQELTQLRVSKKELEDEVTRLRKIVNQLKALEVEMGSER